MLLVGVWHEFVSRWLPETLGTECRDRAVAGNQSRISALREGDDQTVRGVAMGPVQINGGKKQLGIDRNRCDEAHRACQPRVAGQWQREAAGSVLRSYLASYTEEVTCM